MITKMYLKHMMILLIFIISSYHLRSQSSPSFTVFTPQSLIGVSTMTTTGSNNMVIPSINKLPTGLREKCISSKIYFKLDLGDDYVIDDKNIAQKYKVVVDLNYQISPNPTVFSKTLEITNTSPEYLKIDDVLSVLNGISSNPQLSVNVISVSITDNDNTNPLPLASGLLKKLINTKLRLSVKVEREYAVDVRLATNNLMSTAPTINAVAISNRLVTFNWAPVAVTSYPNYEIQILKLYNTNPNFQNNLNQISTSIDWSKALRIETQSPKTNIKLTMAEGSGYYIWRVRPIGNYYKGGIANSENYGEWSNSLADNTSHTLNKNSLSSGLNPTPYAFYFTDPDENINWIYSRVFTEGDQNDKSNPTGVKSSEGISYADGLLNSRQNQKYNSSEDRTIVSQTIHDFSGRPALSTIPVPVNGNLNGYKVGFVTNSNGDLYTAAMFDKDANENLPTQVNDASNTSFSYYSENSSTINNDNVPSAEGYPFKRTKFKTDGTNRVTEESGVGKTHSLGTYTDGKLRTTRVLYGSPSDEELIRIFGDEAPLAESVIKTITIDPNNVASVSYTSKEGKTIATALISDESNNLMPLAKNSETISIKNSIDQNTLIGDKIIASKRITISEDNTKIKLNYLAGTFGNGGACAGGDCNLKLRFYMVDLKNNITYVSDSDPSNSGNQPFNQTSSSPFSSLWKFVSSSGSIIPSVGVSGPDYNEIVLHEGEYVFIKEICSDNGNVNKYADLVVDAQNEKTKLIFDAITSEMQKVQSAADYTVFTTWYETLRGMVNTYDPLIQSQTDALIAHLKISLLDLPNNGAAYTFSLTGFTLSALTQSTVDPNMSDMTVNTGCCGSLTVPIPKPEICYLCDGRTKETGTLTGITAKQNANDDVLASIATTPTTTPYGIEDFKAEPGFISLSEQAQRDAIYSLVELEMIKPLKDKMDEENIPWSDLWKYAPGYSFESLHYMFSNMLISHYFTGKATEIGSGNWYKINDNGTVTPFADLPPTYNYDCKKMYESWTNAIMMLNSFEADGADNIVGSFNEQDGENSAQNETDDDDNWEDMSNFQKKYLKKKLSKEMEEFSDSDDGKIGKSKVESLTSLISNFMEFVGPQYAAIIDGQPLPGYISTLSGGTIPSDYGTALATPFTYTPAATYTTVPSLSTPTEFGGTNVPVLFELNGNTIVPTVFNCPINPGPNNELYYPYIVKPEWIFKYYVYNVFNDAAIPDDHKLIPNQVLVDINRLYNHPTKYIDISNPASGYVSGIPLCKEPPLSSYTNTQTPSTPTYTYYNTHEYWSAAERLAFYKEIKGSPKCYEIKGVEDPVLETRNPLCPSKSDLKTSALKTIDMYITQVDDLSSEVKSSLTNELTSSCYTIVPCKTNVTGEVTDAEIDLMTQAVLDSARAQLTRIKTKLTGINVTGLGNSPCNTNAPIGKVSVYGTGDQQLPYSVLTACQDINLLKPTNTLTVTTNSTIEIVLFADCDLKLMEMISEAKFIPYIAPLNNSCPKTVPAYISCPLDNTNCDPDYGEKTSCPDTNYKTYSKTYQIQASSN